MFLGEDNLIKPQWEEKGLKNSNVLTLTVEI